MAELHQRPQSEGWCSSQMLVDYHVHTTFSDGKSDLTNYVREAEKKRLDEIGFSDHIHFKKESWSMSFVDLPIYVHRITSLKASSRVSVKIGLEVDFIPSEIDGLMQVINGFDFDYLIGSVHHLGDWLIDTERQIDKWKWKDVDEVYQQYYTVVQSMVKTGLFDIVGHLDLAKKFGFRPKGDLTDVLSETVGAISKKHMCVEANTSGLRRPCHEIYPSEKLLEMCFNHGVPVTMGSDAHMPEHVASDFGQARTLLRKVGYTQIVSFNERKLELKSL